ncbi:MAG: hypothetical protein IJN42_04495 [Clostridia bacterium]|nr:hypothetical protein [Clostridia bacterium]
MENTQTTGFAKIKDWILKHSHILLVFGGILLIVCSMKTQTILLTDMKDEKYTVELQYSIFGYCVSAMPMTDEAQSIATEYMYLLDGIDESVEKTARWIAEKSDGGVEVYVHGYPRNSDRLTQRLIDKIKALGIEAVELEAK